MDRRTDAEPGTHARRYEQLTGGVHRRRTYYAVRKVLHFARAEWDALPWHDQRMYLEELAADLDGRRSDGDQIDETDEAQMRAGLPDPPEQQALPAGGSERPDWLRLPIKETQFG